MTPIQSISGRLNSYSTDTTLNLILNTEGVFNYFFIGLIFFLWIYKSLMIFIKNQNYIFVFNLTFAIIFFLQTFVANLFALFPIYFFGLFIFFYMLNEVNKNEP